MSFVLDTDICSAYLKGDRRVFNRFIQHSGGLHISAVTAGELYSWIFRADASTERLTGLNDLLGVVTVIPVDLEVAECFGRKRAELLDLGITVPTADLIIAATALANNFSMVTHNRRHFELVQGLRIEDWLVP